MPLAAPSRWAGPWPLDERWWDIERRRRRARVQVVLEGGTAHVLVIGDGRNDVGMFRWALENGGRAVAMQQGPQEVRDAAGETTSSVQEGGVAAVLRGL